MTKDVKQLKEKLEDVDIQLHESQVRCDYLADDNESLLQQLRQQREELEAEKRVNSQVNIKDNCLFCSITSMILAFGSINLGIFQSPI